MFLPLRTFLVGVAAAGNVLLCPLCLAGVAPAQARTVAHAAVTSDTATVRLHISGMTCGSCPATARLALKKLPGVYSATVTLDDSLGVVQYDPARVTPDQIAAQLAKLTGFRANVLQHPQTRSPLQPGGERKP